MKYARRSFLASCALGAGLAPLAGVLGSALAVAPSEVASAFVGIYMPHGVARELWRPKADFVLDFPDSSLSPFDDAETYGVSFRERLLVLEGVDLTAGMRGGSAGHDGSRALLTGSAFEGTNPSLDQFLAVQQGLGSATPLASLVLGVGNPETRTSTCISYAPGGTPLPKLVDPSQTFQQVIGQWQSNTDPHLLAEQLAARQRGQSVLDTIRADLRELSARVGAVERAKLEAHETALRALEKKLAGFELACSQVLPDVPAELQPASPAYFDAIAELQVELIGFAISCGVTRFATLYLADLSYTHLDPSMPDDVHEGVAHRYSASSDDGAAPGDPETWLALARHNRYSHSQVARLLQYLTGTGALDTTVVLATSDMGDPARHSSRNLPTLIVAGAKTGIRCGRYLDVRSSGAGTPNNHLLVSLARRFGADIESFGDAAPELATGTIDL